MNFKKFISGVSALTIAASAFAGMAVTANAAVQNMVNNTFETAETSPFTSVGRGSSSIQDGQGDNTTKIVKFATNSNAQNAQGHKAYIQANSPISSAEFDFNLAGQYMAVDLANLDAFDADVDVKGNFASTRSNGVVWSFGTTRQKVGGSNSDCIGINGDLTLQNESAVAKNTWYHAVIDVDYTNKTTSYSLYAYNSSGDYSSATPVLTESTRAFYDTSLTGYADSILFTCGNNSQIGYIDNVILNTDTDLIPKYSYSVKAVDANNSNLVTIASGDVVAGELNVYVPKAVKSGDNYYVLNDNTISNYVKTINVSSNGANEFTVSYTKDESIVYYADVEKIGNAVYPGEGSYSNGTYAAIQGGKRTSLASLGSGVYSIEANIAGNQARYLTLRNSNAASYSNEILNISTAGIQTETFSLSATTTVYVSGKTVTQDNGNVNCNQSADIDYILIRRTGDYPYAITKADTENGSFEVSAATATAGTTVTITPSAASGYEVDTVTVKDSANNDVTVTNNSFTMPASDVTVSVTFIKTVVNPDPIQGDVALVGTYTTAEGYDADTKAWKITFDPGEYTFNRVVVTPSEGDAQEYEAPNVSSDGDVVFGIIATGAYYNSTFTAVASYVE